MRYLNKGEIEIVGRFVELHASGVRIIGKDYDIESSFTFNFELSGKNLLDTIMLNYNKTLLLKGKMKSTPDNDLIIRIEYAELNSDNTPSKQREDLL